MKKEEANSMQRLCGAKCRTTGGQPCRNYAMKNGRCRMHGGCSTGPRTPEGKRRQALASTKTGLWTKEAVKAKRENRELLSQGKAIVDEAQRKLEVS